MKVFVVLHDSGDYGHPMMFIGVAATLEAAQALAERDARIRAYGGALEHFTAASWVVDDEGDYERADYLIAPTDLVQE